MELEEIKRELDNLSQKIRVDLHGCDKPNELAPVYPWDFTDLLSLRDTVDRMRHSLESMLPTEKVFAITGEFDDDEIVENPLLGFAKSKYIATRIATKANALIANLKNADKAREDVKQEWMKHNPKPNFSPRIGKPTEKDLAEIAKEREIYNEWLARYNRARISFDVQSPILDDEESKMFPIVQRYSSSMWEGGFDVEEVTMFE